MNKPQKPGKEMDPGNAIRLIGGIMTSVDMPVREFKKEAFKAAMKAVYNQDKTEDFNRLLKEFIEELLTEIDEYGMEPTITTLDTGKEIKEGWTRRYRDLIGDTK